MPENLAVEASGLTKTYKDVEALRGIDLRDEAGSVLGLLGPNGAGKTTAVRILTTLLPPTSGTATVMGLDVVDDAPAAWDPAVAVPSRRNFCDYPTREGVRYGLRLSKSRRGFVNWCSGFDPRSLRKAAKRSGRARTSSGAGCSA